MQGVAKPMFAQQKLAQGNTLSANDVIYHYNTFYNVHDHAILMHGCKWLNQHR